MSSDAYNSLISRMFGQNNLQNDITESSSHTDIKIKNQDNTYEQKDIEIKNQKNTYDTLISRMFENIVISERDDDKKTNEITHSTTLPVKLDSSKDNLFERIFNNDVKTSLYTDSEILEMISEVVHIDNSIKEYNTKLRKCRSIKKVIEFKLLEYLESCKRQGIQVNETNEIFASSLKTKLKKNKNPEKTNIMQNFINSKGIRLSDNDWREFEKIWKSSSNIKQKCVVLKRIKK